MIFSWSLLTLISLSTTGVLSTPSKRTYDTHNYYALEYFPGRASLDEVTTALGVEVVEQAGVFKDTWLVRVEKPTEQLDQREESVDLVLSTLEKLQTHASSHITSRSEETLLARRVVSSVSFLERQTLQELVKRAPPPPITPPDIMTIQKAAERYNLKDPLFSEQWHLVNDEYPEHMMNITPVWDMGLTGKGILVSYIDDGLDNETEDLKDAFDAENSYDFNDHVKLPKPVGARDHHGTRCAGQVAARKNNACGVGIAYDSKAAGVRILGGRITTIDEAHALNYGYDKVGIYSCSWGPRDNGKTMGAPNYLIRKAFAEGINNGRGGKGSIFVFASGNGGRHEDQCNFDGYTNTIYSVTVGSIDYKGLHPTYSEGCAANMIVAYSSGSGKHITTTDRGKECSHTHGGTSAAAPNAVGVFALALQARPDLTWRDIQHLCVETARKVNPHDPDWERTASGRTFSNKYGYGALDAYAYVKAAQTWKLVKPQARIITNTTQLAGGKMLAKYKYDGGEPINPSGVKDTIAITKAMMLSNNFETLEHIDVRVWINHTRRGDVEVELVSPNGIKSVLAETREDDEAKTGFPGWRFMTVKHWGENPIGNWTIKVSDQDNENEGQFLGWNMVLWGSVIEAANATKFWQTVVDNVLPPSDVPDRHVLDDEPDPTATTTHAKPTDHLPADHGSAMSPQPSDSDSPSDAWYSHMATLVSAQKWFFAGLGAASVFLIATLVYFWRRRMSKQRLAEYTSLAANDIHMDPVGQIRVPGTGRPRTARVYDGEFEEASREDLAARSEPPVIVPSAAVGLGFHSGFLDDDEPSAALSPKYRDEPESANLRSVRSMRGTESPRAGGGE